MSKENLEQFLSKVADSDELLRKIGQQIDAEALIALGAECGCEFTAAELHVLCTLNAVSDISFAPFKAPHSFIVLFERMGVRGVSYKYGQMIRTGFRPSLNNWYAVIYGPCRLHNWHRSVKASAVARTGHGNEQLIAR